MCTLKVSTKPEAGIISEHEKHKQLSVCLRDLKQLTLAIFIQLTLFS